MGATTSLRIMPDADVRGAIAVSHGAVPCPGGSSLSHLSHTHAHLLCDDPWHDCAVRCRRVCMCVWLSVCLRACVFLCVRTFVCGRANEHEHYCDHDTIKCAASVPSSVLPPTAGTRHTRTRALSVHATTPGATRGYTSAMPTSPLLGRNGTRKKR